ncbi:MAG: thioredoxin family protein [Epsilonproteobacteria bacterium]|nr:thioredoxin family protein [Campylobacterota bacterium]
MKKFILTILLLLFSTLNAGENTKYGPMILLYIEMDNCPWCERMDRELFDDKFNYEELESMYIVRRMRKESRDRPTFIRPKYYPTTYILSSDGSTIVDELPGYMKAEDFLEYLETLHSIETETP